jgi:hypothetical protein
VYEREAQHFSLLSILPLYVMDANPLDPSSESGSTSAPSPHHRQSALFLEFLVNLRAPKVCQCILDVLDYMESLQLNLSILLWALCWNEAHPDLVSNSKARFARTVLTTSELLPGILRLWHHPPCAHSRGLVASKQRLCIGRWMTGHSLYIITFYYYTCL